MYDSVISLLAMLFLSSMLKQVHFMKSVNVGTRLHMSISRQRAG